MKLLILGPQGSGKGTQAKRISAEYGIPHIATGEMFRTAIAEGGELGGLVEPILRAGELVPDELTVALIRERLSRPDALPGFVLDGFPRNLAQAEALDAMLTEIHRELDAILFFMLDDETAIARALGRAAEEARTDDTPEAIGRRLAIYHEQTEPVVERYRTTGRLVPLHADRSIGEVWAEILEALRLLDDGRRMIIRKGHAEIDRIARAELVADTIRHVGERVRPGMTTEELDRIAGAFIASRGGRSASLGYKGYPAEICISRNDMVVHGIPGADLVRDGDLITIDVGASLDGAIADSAYTFSVGEVDEEANRLLATAKEALYAGIAQAREGNRVGDISHAVQVVVEAAGFSVIRSLVGHGVGRFYHEDPHVPNFGQPGRGPKLAEGMTIAIEPMITAGGPDVYLHADGWSISTEDGSLAAHFEHTVAITENGPRILTPNPLYDEEFASRHGLASLLP